MKLTNHDALLMVVLERRQWPTRWSPVGGQEPGVAFAKGKGKCAGLSMDCLSVYGLSLVHLWIGINLLFGIHLFFSVDCLLVPLSQPHESRPHHWSGKELKISSEL
ncbi:hypothetical protein FH972_001768 [Carpinus fangiana]|uniref:Uncharacterized protein n=1 Tax=Carpinus fangiana TaxID=176857 RepID=A0A5N6QCW6_9ROSI|nr:hypothetical protein FH972_001768 [Carpinus fangiana]